MTKRKPKVIVREFDIGQCASAIFLSQAVPTGYEFVEMKRKGKKAKAWYRKKEGAR